MDSLPLASPTVVWVGTCQTETRASSGLAWGRRGLQAVLCCGFQVLPTDSWRGTTSACRVPTRPVALGWDGGACPWSAEAVGVLGRLCQMD